MKKILFSMVLIGLCSSIVWAQTASTQRDPVRRDQNTTEGSSLKKSTDPWRCGQPFTDTRNGMVYNTIPIVNQCWMKENMNIGTRLDPYVDQSNNGIIEKYCYADAESNCDIYGGLYRIGEALQYNFTIGAQGICPSGWHVPSEADFYQFNYYLFTGNELLGGMLKETGTSHWNTPNTGATDEFGFSARGCGFYYPWGWPEINYYWGISEQTGFWVSKDMIESGVLRSMEYNSAYFGGGSNAMQVGYSVRCLSNVPVNTQTIRNVDIISQTRCYNATDTIIVAGDTSHFTVGAMANASIIAGNNIQLLPGTRACEASYFHVTVTSSGQYCTVFVKSTETSNYEQNTIKLPGDPWNSTCSVYPNPATESLTISINRSDPSQKVTAELFNSFGIKLLSDKYAFAETHKLSIESLPPGFYFLKVSYGKQVFVMKLIRE